jgi:excisionase family DNA binding protein
MSRTATVNNTKQAPTSAPDRPAAFLRVSRVAELLDISRPSVYELINNGDLKGVIRVGSRLRISATALDEYVKSRKI